MQRVKIIAFFIFLALFLPACSLPEHLPIPTVPAQTDVSQEVATMIAATLEVPLPTNIPVPSITPTPTPIPTYIANIPLVIGPPPDLGDDWKLVPHKQDASRADLNFNFQIQAPFIETSHTSRVADQINQEFQDVVDKAVKTVYEQIDQTPLTDMGGFEYINYQVTSSRGWKPPQPYSQIATAASALNAERAQATTGHSLLSIQFELMAYTGGAHPGTHHVVINYDLTTGQPVTLAKLFKPDSDYLEVIANYCQGQLDKRKELLTGQFKQGATATAENYRIWNVTRSGLLITFEEGQVGPMAAGYQQVLIPYSALADVIIPNGPLANTVK